MGQGVEPVEADVLAFGRRIRSMRTGAGLTLREVAARAGVSKSLLSQVERGSAQPSLITIRRLALALGVSAAAFFVDSDAAARDGQGPDGARLVIRVADRLGVVVPGAAAHWQVLVPNLENDLLVLHGELAPGGATPGARQASTHAGEECVVCLEGEIVCESEGRVHVLAEGDAITFATNHADRLINRTTEPARFLVALCR